MTRWKPIDGGHVGEPREDTGAEAFEDYRGLLFSVAYRMMGTVAERRQVSLGR